VGEQATYIRWFCLALLACAALLLAGAARAEAQTAPVMIATKRIDAASLPVTARAPWSFQLAGVLWSGTARLEVRARRLNGRWTQWVPATTEAPAWMGASSELQLRRAGPGKVSGIRLSFISSPPVGVEPAPPMSARARAAASVGAPEPPIISRSRWKADESIRRDNPEIAPGLKMIYVHHTDTASVYSCHDSARIVRGIYVYHVKTNGWDDIGYNFLIDRCGQIFEGRWGGVGKPVVGAHARGFNTGSSGIAMIGTFNSAPPTKPARRALRDLIAWRLDVAHVDPEGRTMMVTSGNERFPPGARVWLRTVSGHRDTGATACPGSALYALLPRFAHGASLRGQPKIFSPQVERVMERLSPSTVAPMRFRARITRPASWTLAVRGPDGIVAMRTGEGTTVNWEWDGRAPVLPAGSYRWTLTSPGARSVSWPIGELGSWGKAGLPETVAGQTITSGDARSLQEPDGNLLQVDGTPSSFRATTTVGISKGAWLAAGQVGGSVRMTTGGDTATIEIWDFAGNRWVTAGTCRAVASQPCAVTRSTAGGTFGHWTGAGVTVRMRVTYPGPMSVDTAHSIILE
jgi:hypothetical protein